MQQNVSAAPASEIDFAVEDEVTKALNTANNILYSKTIHGGVKKFVDTLMKAYFLQEIT